jgi:putative glutamine amidotransferase
VIDGHAPDGTAEALYVRGAPGFTLSVQWHPEWNAGNDPVSRPLFKAFGTAVAAWAGRAKTGAGAARPFRAAAASAG